MRQKAQTGRQRGEEEVVLPGGAQGFDDGLGLELAFVVLRFELDDDVWVGEARKCGLGDVESPFDLNAKSVLVDALHFDWSDLNSLFCSF